MLFAPAGRSRSLPLLLLEPGQRNFRPMTLPRPNQPSSARLTLRRRFGASLGESGFAGRSALSALFGFNLGVEAGQLAVLVAVLPLTAILTLPIIFAAGMSLLDSADGILMCGAYGWAFKNPARKVFYNLTVTGLSVFVALFIGTVELASIASDRLFGVHDGVWGRVQAINMQGMGYFVTAAFLASWALSLAIWKIGKFDEWATPSDG